MGGNGQRTGLKLPDFLQLIASEGRTCTLAFEFGEENGVLYFKQGELIDAETGQLQGNDAVHHMASWSHAKIDIAPHCAKTVKKVQGSLTELLGEERRRQDGQVASAPVVAPERAAAAPGKEPGSERSGYDIG